MGKTVEQIRVENARWLCRHEAGGVLAEFGRRVGASNRQQVANWIGKNPTRSISSETARQIERSFGRPVGWLDVEQALSASTGLDVTLSRLPGDAGALRGSIPGVSEAVVQHMAVTKEWVRRNIGARAPEHLSIAVVAGDAMRDSMPEGSIVVIDRSVSDVREDGVYLLGRSDDATAAVYRRVSRGVDSRLHLTADNPGVKPETITSLRSAKLVSLGRVVVVLSVRRV